MQLAQADAKRGVLDQERLSKIRDAVTELASDLSDRDEPPAPKGEQTTDAETSSAVESVSERAAVDYDLPVLAHESLPPEWQAGHPVLCVAGSSLID